MEGLGAELAATKGDAARTEARLEAEFAAVREVAEQAQSSATEQRFFAVRAAECQVRAALEEYRFLYFRETVDVYRGGQPSTFLDTDKVWENYMANASWIEASPSFGIRYTSLLLVLDMHCASRLDALLILGRQYCCPVVEF